MGIFDRKGWQFGGDKGRCYTVKSKRVRCESLVTKARGDERCPPGSVTMLSVSNHSHRGGFRNFLASRSLSEHFDREVG